VPGFVVNEFVHLLLRSLVRTSTLMLRILVEMVLCEHATILHCNSFKPMLHAIR
jgi:hypothetical protein